MKRWWTLIRLSFRWDAVNARRPADRSAPVAAGTDPATRAFDDVHRYLLQVGRAGPQPPSDLPRRIMDAVRQVPPRHPENRLARNGGVRNWRWVPATAGAAAIAGMVCWLATPSQSSRESLEVRALLHITHLEGQRWAWEVFEPGLDPLQREWELTRREVQHMAQHIWSSVP